MIPLPLSPSLSNQAFIIELPMILFGYALAAMPTVYGQGNDAKNLRRY